MTAALPDWLEPLPDAERMRATDAWAIENGYVSITPVTFDLTAHSQRAAIEAWGWRA